MKKEISSYLIIAIISVLVLFTSCKKKKDVAGKGDVYVAGYEYSFQAGSQVAKLWKNGVAQNLSDGTRYAMAYSVFVVE